MEKSKETEGHLLAFRPERLFMYIRFFFHRVNFPPAFTFLCHSFRRLFPEKQSYIHNSPYRKFTVYTSRRIHNSPYTQVAVYTSRRLHKSPYKKVTVYTSRRMHMSPYTQVIVYTRRCIRKFPYTQVLYMALNSYIFWLFLILIYILSLMAILIVDGMQYCCSHGI